MWNPRYTAYARAHGRTPDAMIEADRESWPGGVMCGFILWIQEQLAAWNAEHNRPRNDFVYCGEEDAFTAWLGQRPVQTPKP